MGFKKIQNLAQNTKVLAFGFTEKASFWDKNKLKHHISYP
jgi:hypothetical protein